MDCFVHRFRGEADKKDGELLGSAATNVVFDCQDVSTSVPNALFEPEDYLSGLVIGHIRYYFHM